MKIGLGLAVMLLGVSGYFLGFGIPSYIPTWGNMLSRSQDFFRKAPHLVVAPGVLISLVVLALYVVGDGLRDALDPTLTEG